jgi:hypothetical protein
LPQLFALQQACLDRPFDRADGRMIRAFAS